jgi:DUF218 domain
MKVFCKIIFFLIAISTFTSCFYLKHGNIKSYKRAEKKPYDAVIIPGFPYYGKQWNPVIKFRLIWALHLYEKGLAKNFIFSGACVHSPYNEGMIMALYAASMGIPIENIFIEPNAEHSSENVYYSILLADSMHFESIAVATDPVQSFLLSNFTQRLRNRQIDFLSFRFKIIRKRKYHDEPKIDKWLAFENDFSPLNEKMNYWKRKKASLGLSINYGKRPTEVLKYSKWLKW